MGKITNKELEALKPTDAGKKLREDGGLVGVVRLKADGTVSVQWKWRYRFAGKVKETALGTWPKMSMPAIREERKRLAALLDQGRDPADETKAAKLKARAEQIEAIAAEKARIAQAEAQAARMTVRELFDRWEKGELTKRKTGSAEVRRMFEKDVFPAIGRMHAADVRRGDIAALLDKVAERGVTRMVAVILSLVRQMFRYAVTREWIDTDPTALLKKTDFAGKPTERERALGEAEIRELAKRLPKALGESQRRALWIQLATCCRIGELMAARWEHIDLDAGTWIIPAENSKNGRAHIVSLSDFAIGHFKALRKLTGHSEWVFPARHKDGHVCPKSLAKQIADRQRGNNAPMARRSPLTDALMLPGGKWTPHDLRRTGATLMAALGVRPDVIERCLNHTEQNKIQRIYQRHSYEAEQREAWRLLGERLELLTSGESNVTTMPKRKAA